MRQKEATSYPDILLDSGAKRNGAACVGRRKFQRLL